MSVSEQAARVLVLGANGFLGRRLIQALQAAGFAPVGAGRRAGPGEWRVCDATDAASVAAAVAGCDYAVNCVAGDGPTMLAATRNLVAAPGLQRIVHLSSMAVYGAATGLVEEAHALDAGGGWYGEAKIGCERVLAESGREYAILRPGCIHGPQSAQWTTRIGKLLQQHRIGDLGPAGDGICNLVYIDDVAAAVIVALTQPGAAGEAFNLSDPAPGSWNDYFMTFARAIGAVPVTRVHGRWLKLEKLAAIPLKIGEKAKLRMLPEAIPGSLMGLWRQDIQLDHRKADRLLGFARTPPGEAIAKAASWFRGV